MGKVYVGKSDLTLSLGCNLTVKKKLLFKFLKKKKTRFLDLKRGLSGDHIREKGLR